MPTKEALAVAKLKPDPFIGVEEAESVADLSTYPSPASDQVNVSLPFSLQAHAALDVLDITGRIVLHQNIRLGVHTFQIPVEAWANGIYCLRLDTGVELLTTRFVKR